ncbi:hypothetical protein AMATHDRAFT_7972, partial [Amanita thiersii Skay4041]
LFESPAIPSEHPTLHKWGLLLGIHKRFQAIPVPLPPSLSARVVATDIIIPSVDNTGFRHRLFGIYAPWSYPPQNDPSIPPQLFWDELRQLCTNTPSSWSLIGDFNAVLLASESTSPSAFLKPTSLAYSAFLRQTNATDLWLHQANSAPTSNPTFIGTQSSATLDRACISPSGIPEAAVSSPRLFIPYTDHRIIRLTLLLLSPSQKPASSPSFLEPSFPLHPYYPSSKNKNQFQLFSQEMADSVLNYSPVFDMAITDDYSFQFIYDRFSSLLQSAAAKAFNFRSITKSKSFKTTNATISLICRETKVINRIISALRQQHSIPFPCNHSFQQLQWAYLHETQQAISFITYLCLIRKSLNKLRFREQENELAYHSQSQDNRNFNAVLKGASSARLYSTLHISPPRALLHTSQQILTDPAQIKAETVEYFTQLYARTPHESTANKPWLETPTIQQIRHWVLTNPFSWPRPLTLSDLRSLLRRGNPRPAPGPDRWEKWMIKTLPDSALTIILKMLNYEITTSHIPNSIKPCSLSLIHKRASRLQLTNYRDTTILSQMVKLLHNLEYKVEISQVF